MFKNLRFALSKTLHSGFKLLSLFLRPEHGNPARENRRSTPIVEPGIVKKSNAKGFNFKPVLNVSKRD